MFSTEQIAFLHSVPEKIAVFSYSQQIVRNILIYGEWNRHNKGRKIVHVCRVSLRYFRAALNLSNWNDVKYINTIYFLSDCL